MIQQKRSLVVLLLVLAILASACQASASAASQPQTSTATVSRGSLQAIVSAAGTIAAQAQVAVQFQNSGTVKAVNVKVGDQVKAGQVMAILNTTDLEASVASAQAGLDMAQASLATAQKAPLPSEIKSAEAALASAQAALRAAQNKTAHLSDQVTLEKASLDDAAERLSDAQGTYNNLLEYQRSGAKGRGAPYVPPAGQEWSQEKAALDNAQVEYKVAVANYNLAAAEVNNSDVQSAAAQVASAQATLDSLKSTPASGDVQVAELAVKTAQIALDQAKLNLKNSQLVAPFDGVVAVVNIQVGQQVSSSAEAITVANLSQLEAEVNVSETDLPSIKVGQSVQVTFDALTSQTFTGTVTNVALVGTTTSGVVNYPVTIALDQPSTSTSISTSASASFSEIRPGMSANVSIVVEQRDNLLLVPNRAIKTSGKLKTVTVLKDGKQTQVNVTLGMSGDSQSEVTNGLSEGDVVIVQQTTTTTTNQGGAGGGGLGGPPGGF
jgi:HlyD family secretion protein